jgi:uncharacterized membrane protein YwzB
MDMYGVVAVCIIVPIIVMSAVYYMLKDMKFDTFPTPQVKKRN